MLKKLYIWFWGLSQSNELRAFYVDMQVWISGGCTHGLPTIYPMLRNLGLCANLHRWLIHHYRHKTPEFRESICRELRNQFTRETGYFVHPFNSSYLGLIEEGEIEATYGNPKRLAWIRDHCRW